MMKYISRKDLDAFEKYYRINLINSITGIKPANLIGTSDNAANSNLAIFSSVVHLGSNPPLIGMISRPDADVPRHTLLNIKSQGCFTINHVGTDFIQKAHYTSAKFKADDSEFEKCQLSEEWIDNFGAPFVKESPIKMGLELKDLIPIDVNKTIMIVGEIKHIILNQESISEEGYLNLENSKTAGISGLNSYYSLKHLEDFPYARPDELPNFK